MLFDLLHIFSSSFNSKFKKNKAETKFFFNLFLFKIIKNIIFYWLEIKLFKNDR